MEQQIYSQKEFAKVVGFSVSTLRRRIREGVIAKPVKISNGRVGWFRKDIENYLNRLNQIRDEEQKQTLAYVKTWRTK